MTYKDYYHCRYCDYKVKKWWTGKGGKRYNGQRYLEEHVACEHEYGGEHENEENR